MTPFQNWRTFKPDVDKKPYGWVQWKGTSVCMDVHCICGNLNHLDDDFTYYVKCGSCGRVYEVAGFVEFRLVPEDEKLTMEPVEAEDFEKNLADGKYG